MCSDILCVLHIWNLMRIVFIYRLIKTDCMFFVTSYTNSLYIIVMTSVYFVKEFDINMKWLLIIFARKFHKASIHFSQMCPICCSAVSRNYFWKRHVRFIQCDKPVSSCIINRFIRICMTTQNWTVTAKCYVLYFAKCNDSHNTASMCADFLCSL